MLKKKFAMIVVAPGVISNPDPNLSAPNARAKKPFGNSEDENKSVQFQLNL